MLVKVLKTTETLVEVEVSPICYTNKYGFSFYDGKNIITIKYWESVDSYIIDCDVANEKRLSEFISSGVPCSYKEFMDLYEKAITRSELIVANIKNSTEFQVVLPKEKESKFTDDINR